MIAKTLIDRLYVELLVDADGNTRDAAWGLPLLREKCSVVAGADGTPQLVWS